MTLNTCIVCGKKFEAVKATKKYCSDECMKQARNKRAKENKPMPEKQCLLCKAFFSPKTPAANQRSCCYDCMPDGVQLRRGDFLAKLKLQRGGECQRCGYNKCIKVLEFHHIDPTQKDFTISNDHFRLKEAIEESKKCIVLCANCHRELHEDLWDIQDILKERDSVDL